MVRVIHQNHGGSGHDTSSQSSVIYTSGYNTSTPYISLQAQNIDWPTGLRGQATILATRRSGKQELLYSA